MRRFIYERSVKYVTIHLREVSQIFKYATIHLREVSQICDDSFTRGQSNMRRFIYERSVKYTTIHLREVSHQFAWLVNGVFFHHVFIIIIIFCILIAQLNISLDDDSSQQPRLAVRISPQTHKGKTLYWKRLCLYTASSRSAILNLFVALFQP